MANFFSENKDIVSQFNNLDIEEVVRIRENDFAYAGEVSYAPESFKDATDNYRRVLEVVGEMAADFIAPMAEDVDNEGSHLQDNGKVKYAEGIAKALEAMKKADLMGFTLPYQYGGLNFPTTIYSIAIELVSRADASLMNIFGLQDIAETVNEFGSDEQKQRILPMMAAGEATGAMVLTEPDAGSDLQAVQLKATLDESTGRWHLNGVKRFITNGCAQVLLVLARSEPKTKDGRGLSMFLVENDDSVWIRRTEDKLGIHGSPTCEMQFNNTPAELVGRRKFGLIKYVMALMNGARLGISAQGLGIAEAAYQNALDYAKSREQFGKAILNMPPVYDLLTTVKSRITAARALLYYTSIVVDIEKGLNMWIEDKSDPDRANEARGRLKTHKKLADTLTSMTKFYSCELANVAAYQGISVMGGSGYMRDYAAERYFRDARITNIYEGTTQLQVVACIGGLLSGILIKEMEEGLGKKREGRLSEAAESLKQPFTWYREIVDKVKESEEDFRQLHQQRVVEMAAEIFTSVLLMDLAEKEEKYTATAVFHAKEAAGLAEKHYRQIMSNDRASIELRDEILYI